MVSKTQKKHIVSHKKNDRIQNVKAANDSYYDQNIHNINSRHKISSVKSNTELHPKTIRGSFDKLSIVGKAGHQIALGNTNAAAEKLGKHIAGGAVANYAEKLSRKKRIATKRKSQYSSKKQKIEKRLVGPVFWTVASFAIFKDVLDIFFTLTIFLILLTGIFTILISLTILFYLIFNRVPFTLRKIVSLTLMAILEFVPFANLIPATTIGLFVVRYLDNKEIDKKNKKRGKLVFRVKH